MSATNSTISWLQAFQPLPLLALNTMFQPVGRVLGSPANNVGWLRASPFICALGALALVLRLLAYCALLYATVTPRKAMLIIGMDYFDKYETDHISQKRTTITMISRHVTFLISLLPLIYVFGSWREIRWTMAWACMFIASYLVLEIVMQIARHLLEETLEDATGFELEAFIGDDDDDKTPHTGTEDTMHEASDEDQAMNGNVQGINDIDGSTVPQPEPTGSANRTNPSDLEVAKDNNTKYDDPFTSARLSSLKHALNYCDRVLLKLGCTLHAIFVYWAYLDLVQPLLEANILSSTGSWIFLRFILSLPILTFAIVVILILTATLLFILSGAIASALLTFLSKLLGRTFVAYPIVLTSTVVVSFGACWGGAIFLFFYTSTYTSTPQGQDYVVWVSQLTIVEVGLLLLFWLICRTLHSLLKLAVRGWLTLSKKLKVSWYLDEMGVSALTGVLITFTVSILWYRFRFPSFEAGQWLDNWREYLDFNTTSSY
ncbi:hypothetical protein IFM46972_05396 [Aspergillus udagawae]|uniref:Uncharacterized protein n=1 Tax=Aspergillus udagawae TaxID=91492 RepID=A0A8H3RU74_9EURO|nr:hypothetical protein IFM46972_05396 [Aspergillus udagawae]